MVNKIQFGIHYNTKINKRTYKFQPETNKIIVRNHPRSAEKNKHFHLPRFNVNKLFSHPVSNANNSSCKERCQ